EASSLEPTRGSMTPSVNGRRSAVMRTSTLAFTMALALCGGALAQNSGVEADASGQSNTSVSASRDQATVQREDSGAAAVRSGAADAGAQGGEMNATLTKPVDARRAK